MSENTQARIGQKSLTIKISLNPGARGVLIQKISIDIMEENSDTSTTSSGCFGLGQTKEAAGKAITSLNSFFDEITRHRHQQIIEVYFDHEGIPDGIGGCWRARLADDHKCHNTDYQKQQAVANLMLTLATLIDIGNGPLTEEQINNGWRKYKGMSKYQKDYKIDTVEQ